MSRSARITAIVAALATTAAAFPPSDRTILRQALSGVDPGDGTAASNADGRLIAFVSMIRLLPADLNSVGDIYVLDRSTRRLTLESVTPAGVAANGTSWGPRLSGDGRAVVFESFATDLTPLPDGNDGSDVFLRDRVSGVTRRVSVGVDRPDANGASGQPVISSDGLVVAFRSTAINLVPGPDANGPGSDIYVVRLATGRISRVSLDRDGRQFDVSQAPSLDATGTLVAFAARSAAALPAQRGSSRVKPELAVYLRDLSAMATTCVSCSQETGLAGLPASWPDLSADGRVIAFAVQSTPERSDIAVFDRVTSRTAIVTRHANARSTAPRVSADGGMLAFVSWASDLLCGRVCARETVDENLLPDIYLFDTRTGRFTRASGSGAIWWAPSVAPAIDARGTTVIFSSREPFGPEDDSVDFDLYVCQPECV